MRKFCKDSYDSGFIDGYTSAIEDAGWLRDIVREQKKARKMIEFTNSMSWTWAQKELRRLQQAILYFTKTPIIEQEDL